MITSLFPAVLTDAVDDTAHFYRDLFGFETVFEADWYVQLQAPDQPLTQLGIVDRTHESVPAGHRHQPAGILISIEVEDVDEVHARATAAGHPTALSLRDEDWGQRHFITLDPAGTMVDVITPIAPSTADYAAAYTVPGDG